MSTAGDMIAAAKECARTPGHTSVWSKRLGRYVCVRDPEYGRALAEQSGVTVGRAPINAAFKLVFLTAAGGTLLFVIICVTTTLLAGKNPPPQLDKTISSLFDLAKIGFGAVVGLLGARSIKP